MRKKTKKKKEPAINDRFEKLVRSLPEVKNKTIELRMGRIPNGNVIGIGSLEPPNSAL